MLAPNRCRGYPAPGPSQVAGQAHLEREVEDERDRRTMPSGGDLEQLAASPLLDVRRVDDGEVAPLQPRGQRGVEQREGVDARRLVGLVVGDDRAKGVRREDLGRDEEPGGER